MATPEPSGKRHKTMAHVLRFQVFGHAIGVERSETGWHVFYLGNEGKRRPADFVIPEFIDESELLQFLADMLHESASPSHPDAQRLD